MEKEILPLQSCKVQQPLATINKLHTIFHSITILALLYYRASVLLFNPNNLITTKLHNFSWVLIFLSEILFSFLWLLHQAHRWRPVSRTVYPERLPADKDLPAIDVFICTADPKKEPTVGVMNTVLSAMSLDYPPHKLSVYLSDDAGSPITLYAIKQAFVFAKSWIPFCKKYVVETRCPEAYFSASSSKNDELQHLHGSSAEFMMKDKEIIKAKYEVFKQRVEKFIQITNTNMHSNKDHPALVEIIKGNDNSIDIKLEESESDSEVPLLVYIAREKRPSHPHHFKAGALNVLLRVSGIISNSQIVLSLDCDMYCNDPSSARQAMCFHLDPLLNSNSSFGFIQFPQSFHNVSQNDIYNGQIRSLFETSWFGIDGLKGPGLSGTGFYIKREAFYGITTRQLDIDLVQTKQCFGDSSEFIASLNKNYSKFNVIANGDRDGDESSTLVKEAQLLASCPYEKNTQWGEKVGFMYHSVVEDYFTGFLLHCKGWTSAFYSPSKPSFLGSVPINLNDTLVQSTRWSSGLLQVGFSRFCPLIYGLSRMPILQTMAYANLAIQPLYALPTLCFGIIPQLCLFNGISLYPKVSSRWFYVFLAAFVSSLYQNILEILLVGGSIRRWWYDQRIFIIKSVTCFLFGLLDVMMKFLGLKDIEFVTTNKVVDEEQDERYKMGIFDFQTCTTFLLPLTTLSILNMASLVVGLRRVIIERCFDEMFGQIFLSIMILMISYPIIEGMIIRKDNGRIRTSVTLLSVSVVMVLFSFKALLV